MKKRVLFICLGNICRSPTAESIFKHKLKQRQLDTHYHIDSAGTSSNHIGEASDQRSIKHALQRGYVMDHKARQFNKNDFSDFDLLICMDDQNVKNVLKMASTDTDKNKVIKMATYVKNFNDTFILDPWAMGPDAFEKVIDLLEDACENLIQTLHPQ